MNKLTNYIAILLIVVLAPFGASAQLEIDNQISTGGDGSTGLNQIVKTIDAIYVVSYSSSLGSSGNMNTTEYGTSYVFITKYNLDFIFEWRKSYGGSGQESRAYLVEVNDGLLLGVTSDSGISGNKTTLNYGDSDGWLLKLDFNGDILWQKNYGGSDIDGLISLFVTPQNDIIMAYSSISTPSGNRTAIRKGNQDFWIIKTDDVGEIIWEYSYGSNGSDILFDLGMLDNGTIIATGSCVGGSISFDKTESPYSSVDTWVVAIDLDGNVLWDKTIGGNNTESTGYLQVVSDTIFVLSSSASSISGLRDQPLKGTQDLWLSKIDETGNLISNYFFGGDNVEMATGLFKLSNNRILICSRSDSEISYDKSEPSRGGFDYWLIVLDQNGGVVIDKTLGGDDLDNLVAAVEVNNSLFVGGFTNSNVSGDKTIPKFNPDPNFYDVWLVELDATILDIIQTIDIHPSVYPNPVNDYLTINLSEFSAVSKIDVFDYQGKLLLTNDLSNTVNPTTIQLDMTAFSLGMYTVRVYGDNVVRAVKVVK